MDNLTLGQWFKKWIKIYKVPFMKSTSAMIGQINNHIPGNLKNKSLIKVTAFDIQICINSVKGSRTAQSVYNIFKSSFNVAYRLKLIKENVAEMVFKPKHKYKIGSALTKIEVSKFLNDIKGNRAENCFKFLLYSGCRRSEALNIFWSDIDNDSIHIRGTKTEGSDRFIPIFPNLKILLNELRFNKIGNKLFHHRGDYLTKTFHKILPNHKLHDLRHTFSSVCIECDIPLKVIQGWLGHSTILTTGNIYSHIQKSFSLKEAEKLNF